MISEKKVLQLVSSKTKNDENFPVSSFLISKKNGRHIINLYNFARVSDDIADSRKLKEIDKKTILVLFDNILKKKNNSDFKFINNLIYTLQKKKISTKNPRKLLKAFILDTKKIRYKNWNELLNYCNHSASPVGRFVVDLHLKNKLSKSKLTKIYSSTDSLCNCLQILNHLQDLKEDYINLNRVYLPKIFFEKEKITVECLQGNKSPLGLRKIINMCLDNIDKYLLNAEKNLYLISDKRLLKETFVIYFIAKKLSTKLRKEDPLKKKVKLSRIDLIFCFFRGIMKSFKR